MSGLVELLSELVAVDSTNPDLVAGGVGEAEIGRLLAARLTAAGLEVDCWDVAPGRPNVVGRLAGSGGGRSLMLFGHMDVVGADPGQFTPQVREGRLSGRGAVDMKGGIAACVAATQRLAAGPPLAGDLLVAFVSDEEWGSVGAEALVGRHRADASVLAEPSNLEIVDAHGGFAWFDITSTGVDAAGLGGRDRRRRDLAAGAGAGGDQRAGCDAGGVGHGALGAAVRARLDHPRRPHLSGVSGHL